MLADKNSPKSAIACLLGLIFIGSPLQSFAVEWSAQPSASVGTSYNDNINMETGPHDAVWGYSLTPDLTLAARAPQWTLSGHAQINRLDYPGRRVQSRTDHLLDLSYTRQNDRNQWQFTGNLKRDSTLLGELALTGIPVVAERTSKTFAPAWAHSLTERDSVTLIYSDQRVSYRETLGNNLQDFTTRDPSIVLKHTFTERNSMNVSLSYSDYKTDNPLSASNPQYHFITKSVEMGFDRVFSDTLTGSIVAGIHRSNSTIDSLVCAPIPFDCFLVPETTSANSSGSLLNAKLERTFEASKLVGEASRSLQPTGDGGIYQTDQISAAYYATFSPRLTGSIYFAVYNSQRINSSLNSVANRYYNLTPSLAWKLSEWWTTTMSYSHAMTRNAAGAEAKNNAINLTINYNWPRITRSR